MWIILCSSLLSFNSQLMICYHFLEPVIVHYDWANDTWLPGPNLTLPIVTRYHGQVVWSASQVLIIGGLYAGGTTTVNTTMLVDVKSGTVQQMAQTPVALSTPVCAIMVKGPCISFKCCKR